MFVLHLMNPVYTQLNKCDGTVIIFLYLNIASSFFSPTCLIVVKHGIHKTQFKIHIYKWHLKSIFKRWMTCYVL